MKRVTTLLVLVFAIALSAGVVAGRLASRLPASSTPQADASDHSWLAEELQLTREQSDQMRNIWEEVRGISGECYDQASGLQKQREDEIGALLSPDQKVRYNELTIKYQNKMNALTASRQKAFDQAVQSTMKILSPEQQQRYEQILKDRVGHGSGAGPGPNGWPVPASQIAQ